MRKTIGYGYKLTGESVETALGHYDLNATGKLHGLSPSKKNVEQDIKADLKARNISKTAKPVIFKVVVEEA